MTVAALALLAAFGLQADPSRPPRPTDEDLTAALQAERPAARILSQAFRESNRGGARIGCGVIEVEGHPEPFSVVAAWKAPSGIVITLNGVVRPEPAAHWAIRISAPSRSDYDEDGDIDRTDRNYDVLKRMQAKMWCGDLEPPPGVVWAMESEPDPDPARAARIRALTARSMELLFPNRQGQGGQRP
jgi:hypothetical protein